MQLISDIINNLIDDEKSIYSTLLKTKVLASRIDNEKMLNWVNSELNGYPTDDALPIYRKNYGSHIKGDYLIGNTKYSNQPIPTNGFKEKFGIDIAETTFRQGVSTLEQMIIRQEGGSLMQPFPAEIVGYLEASWKQLDLENGYFLNLINAKKIIAIASVQDVLSQVRNRLLDFLLELDKKFGSITEIKDLTNKNKEITQIMEQTIINTSGDGNIVNTGNSNKIKADIIIEKSNKEQLEKQLKENNVSDLDIKELTQIIDNDTHNYDSKIIGEQTNTWFQKMMGKAIDGSWKISIGTAGGLLAKVIGSYLGF
jgi:AbiTii